ncbi:Putative Holin-X, holin superfamily III [Salipiger abyssi]|uniref:Putative Holin-X, holin superfamily III n=1 Tax=Salipiger abyssi TaxID=1250539 RepID=A0A1P8UWX7_9RHOB|nr:Putative Holin-X, holin superfamily III [Salipiger abyssi]
MCLLVAAVFLTLAAWMALSAAHGAQIAALVIGGVYLLLGAILIASTGRRRPVAPPPPPASVGSLAEAFLAGRAAGQAMGQGRERG